MAQKLGHISEKGMQTLARSGLLPEETSTPHKSCVHCLESKQCRFSFIKTTSRRTRALDLVHSDECGPMKVSSLGGARYFVTFIDDYSRKVWAYALRTKDLVFQAFKYFHIEVERETGRTLKCIRSDNGGEYIGLLRQYYRENDIKHQRTVPKTP